MGKEEEAGEWKLMHSDCWAQQRLCGTFGGTVDWAADENGRHIYV